MPLKDNTDTAEFPPDTILCSSATTWWIWFLQDLYKNLHGSEFWSSVSWTPLRFPRRTFPLSQGGKIQHRVQCRCRPQGMERSRNVLDFSEKEEKNKTMLVTFCKMTNRPLIPIPVWNNFTWGAFLCTLVRVSQAWMQELPSAIWEIWHSKKSVFSIFISNYIEWGPTAGNKRGLAIVEFCSLSL